MKLQEKNFDPKVNIEYKSDFTIFKLEKKSLISLANIDKFCSLTKVGEIFAG